MAETSAQPHSGNNAKSMALTLDEVFALKTSSNHAKRKFKLTPLSKKACLIHGIEPYVLQDREYASFSEPNLDPEIQTMRFEAYSYTRSKLMQVVSNERSKLAARANTSNDSFSTNDSVSFISKTSSLDRKEQEVSTLIENEKRRLEKVANRQKKELIRMLAYESKSQEVMNKVRIKAGEQEKKEMERKKAKRKSELQAAGEARLRELRRRAKEDAEMDLQRLQMQGQFEREKKIQRERQIQEIETRRILRLEDERRAKKQAAYRIEMKKKSEQQQREIELRMKQREEKGM